MQVALVSDTHIPSRATAIPEWVSEEIRTAEHTIHAGDFESAEALTTVEELAGGRANDPNSSLTAVAGNVDPPELGLPETATLDAEGVTFVVTHGTGSRRNYEERVARTVRGAAGGDRARVVGVSGHTHEVLDEEREGVRLLNPGSATGAEPAAEPSMMVVEVTDGGLDVDVRRG